MLIQPKTGEDFNNKRNIDYWDPTNEARILKAVSIITFGIVERNFFTYYVKSVGGKNYQKRSNISISFIQNSRVRK